MHAIVDYRRASFIVAYRRRLSHGCRGFPCCCCFPRVSGLPVVRKLGRICAQKSMSIHVMRVCQLVLCGSGTPARMHVVQSKAHMHACARTRHTCMHVVQSKPHRSYMPHDVMHACRAGTHAYVLDTRSRLQLWRGHSRTGHRDGSCRGGRGRRRGGELGFWQRLRQGVHQQKRTPTDRRCLLKADVVSMRAPR